MIITRTLLTDFLFLEEGPITILGLKKKEDWFLLWGGWLPHYCNLTVRYLPVFFEYKSRIISGDGKIVKNNQDFRHLFVRVLSRISENF